MQYKFKSKNSFPFGLMFGFILIWIVSITINFYINNRIKYIGTELLFPISVIYPSSFKYSGLAFGLIFFTLGIVVYSYLKKINTFLIFLACITLIVLGNLSQGDFDTAFLQPFYLKGRQYYHDAILIENWTDWLRTFTQHQRSFQLHTGTHPPFITLLHYFFLEISNQNIAVLSLSFFAISSLNILIFYDILSLFGIDPLQKKRLILLFSIIPSINIYTLISIDGIFLTISLIFLLGICRIYKSEKLELLGTLLCIFSIIVGNLISFSGLFFFMFLGLLSFFNILKRNFRFFYLLLLCIVTFVVYLYEIYTSLGYNHLTCFLNASSMENPKGFMLFSQPTIYLATRLENISEILLFLSFPFIAVLFGKKKLRENITKDQAIFLLFLSASLALFTMFLTGAYGTGETARSCLFIVPYFTILLKDLSQKNLKTLYFICLYQTFVMQIFSNFYW